MRMRYWPLLFWIWSIESVAAEELGQRTWPQAEYWEGFLTEAAIVQRSEIAVGVTRSERVTLTLEGETHQAILKKIDEPDDSWRHEVAAYELDRLLGLGLVPPTVKRKDKGRPGGLQLWVDGEKLDSLPQELSDLEAWRRQVSAMWLFDYLTANNDRHVNNVLASPDGGLLMIDNSRTFPSSGSPLRELDGAGGATRALFWRIPFDPGLESYPTTYSLALVNRLKSLSEETLKSELGWCLDKAERRRLLERRDSVLLRIGHRHPGP